MINKFLLVSVVSISFFMLASQAAASVLSKAPNNLGLVGYWTFNEGTSTVALDYSGNKNKGTLVNGPTWVNGKQGKALNCDGVDDYVSAPLDTANIVTVSVWAKMNKSASGDFNFVTQDGGTSGRLSTGWNGVEQFYIAKSGIAYHKLTNVYSLSTYNNSWHHIVFVYNSDNTQSYIYVDGIEASYAADVIVLQKA